ncbi:hypothetical protein JX265_004702 [Neoarthrinium moseri]|uniref:Cytochrome P450 n=1 Tax=Neoarthrinium moseri TaxID=1658444 RepID=A0A9Q0ASE9_9PEZI|nr:hypothetical protein JX266_012221 [Neoarthrinium moseri]KAI1874494.1 hypothetical protein JX265_004702 [Neoarthrinium moseri]
MAILEHQELGTGNASVSQFETHSAGKGGSYSSHGVETNKKAVAPVVPYWFPGIFHLIPFLWDNVRFLLVTIQQYGWEKPLTVKAASMRLAVVVNPPDVVAVFKNSRFLSTRFVIERVQAYLLGIPDAVMPFYEADDSGMAAEPRKGSNVAPEDRILFHQASTHHKYLASPYLDPLVEVFKEKLHSAVEAHGIGEQWVEYPDLFAWLQPTIIEANIETMMGSKLRELNPNFIEDFCVAKMSVPIFLKGWPRWLAPNAFKARDRVRAALEKWHLYANANGDYTTTHENDPDWEPIWGSKCEKFRQQYMNNTQALGPYERACEDWGFLIGLNYNTPPTMFWYLYEALRDPALHARMMDEVAACRNHGGWHSIPDLASQPLLESAYAEVLRLRISIVMGRTVEHGDIKVGGYRVPRGDVVLMPTDSMHFNKEAWTRAGGSTEKPLNEFDAERFLVPSETGKPLFSTDRLAGLWIPYGGGDRMCPGRHLVKLEMLIIYAYLFTAYEIEVNETDMGKIKPNTGYVSFGALPPNRALRFRIRRKQTV